jgi:hypothetical protein
MQLLVETGSESHTTSSARLQAKYHGGPYDGKFLYAVKDRQVAVRWLRYDRHARWAETIYEMPEGTEIEIIGVGHTGPRGIYTSEFHRIYRLDPQADIVEVKADVGLRECLIKGRLTLVKDCIEAAAAAEDKLFNSNDKF